MKKKIRFLIYALIIMGFILINTNSCKKDETTKKDPIITWTNPYEISYGTMLSDIQLNATANVAGTFVYTPDIGIVLNIGVNQILKVNFTPTDAATYNTVTKTVTINVSAVTTVIDIENNVYNAVIIGTQTWMQENLKTTKYRNGTAIPNITDNTAWTTQTTGAYCWYNNDIANKTNYGAFYNYYTVVDSRNLCPTGWHVPTDTEWSTLITYLGGASIAGIKMKATTFWVSSNTYTVNSSGFTALPGGSRSSKSGYCNYIGTWGDWWSATESSTTTAWYRRMYWDRNLYYDYLSIPRDDYDKRSGFSVRCIRDF